ncbi:MAG: 50S ribosomal protein L32 [bacterium]|nr:50S ribosomal protein L32 [bacterium]
MAVPFRRVSKTSKRTRRAHDALDVNNLVVCSNCGKKIRPHRVCKYCGFYKNEQKIEVKSSKKD